MKRRKVDPEIQQVLNRLLDQQFDEQSPGPILADFRMLVEFVGEEGVPSAGKHHLLPLQSLPMLNERLTKPLRVALKRPKMSSLPTLSALYVLLRATGLVKVRGSGAAARLALDPPVLERWRALNLTEQYFTLLEAWLLHASPAHLGERVNAFRDDPALFDVLGLLGRLHESGTAGEDVWKTAYTYSPLGQCHLPLLDLFGLAVVEQGPPADNGAWKPRRVSRTAFGSALGVVLVAYVTDAEEPVDPETGSYGWLRPALSPFFPAWGKTFELPKEPFRPGTHRFRVTLQAASRRIAISGEDFLAELAGAILGAFDFDDDHLYEFLYVGRLGVPRTVGHSHLEDRASVDEVRVGDLPLSPGDALVFRYDFGDEWRFHLLLEEVEPPGRKLKAPKVLERKGEAPPQYGWDD